MRRWRATALAVVTVVVITTFPDDGGGAPPPTSTTATAATAATATTATTAERLLETSSSETEVVDEARDRTLRTVVHRPEGEGPFPLVVLGHGLGGRPEMLGGTAAWLASHGYVVAAPEFPGTAGGTWGDAPKVNDQPADVSAVIDTLTAELGALIDPERIAVVGHSLGAITALLIGYHPCCRDDRVDAVVAWAGGQVFGMGEGAYFDVGAGTPLLLVHGDRDRIVLYLLGEAAYQAAAAPKYLVTLLGGDHVSAFFLDGPYLEVVRQTTLNFLDAYVKGDDDALDRLERDAERDAEVEGVSTLEKLTREG